MICVVKGSNPFRVNGSSVGRVHNKMAGHEKSAVRIRTYPCFYPDFRHHPHPGMQTMQFVRRLKTRDTAVRKEEEQYAKIAVPSKSFVFED